MPSLIHTYNTKQVARISGFTIRQLDYWANTQLLIPSVNVPNGSGTRKLYNFDDLIRLHFIKQLRDAGWSIQTIRKAIKQLNEFMNESQNYRNFRLISDKASILILCETKERQQILLDALTPGAQQVLWIVYDILHVETRKNVEQSTDLFKFDQKAEASNTKKKAVS